MTALPHPVTTVRGPVDLDRPGIIDAHTHLWISPVTGAPADAPRLDDARAILDELRDFRAHGGEAAIDCQPPGTGRDMVRLAALAEASGLAVVASTGFHLPVYYGAGDSPWTGDVASLRRRMDEDLGLHDGAGPGPRAGIVKAAHPGHLRGRARELMQAAAEAAASAGVLLMVHTERGAGVEELAEFLLRLPMPTRDVILCHTDKRPEGTLHRTLAEDGFLLEYDTFSRDRYDPRHRVWPLLLEMLEHGHERAIAIGSDLAHRAQWRFGGDPLGLRAWTATVVDGLRARGVDDASIARLTGANVAERLVMSGAEAASR